MIEITKDEMERLFRRQQIGLRAIQSFSIVWMFLFALLIYVGYKLMERPLFLISMVLIVLLFSLNLIFAQLYDRRNIPKALRYESVKIFSRQMNRDVCSDATVQMCMDGINRADKYEERAQFVSYLGCIFQIRGQFGDALQAMSSLDRTQFPTYPRTAMTYYADLIEIYYAMGNMQSVLAVYAEAEPYFKRCYNKSYLNCFGVTGALVCVHNARGEHQKALEYQLMKLDIEEKFYAKSARNSVQNTMLRQYITGERYYNTAYQYYLCGDFQNADRYLKMSRPLLGISPYRVNCLNQLALEIQKHQYGGPGDYDRT